MSSMIYTKAAAMAVLAVGAVFAQAPAQPLAFEVASIKPSGALDPAKVMSGQFRVGMSVDGARVDLRFMSVGDLIRTAYKIKPHQLVGPEWIKAVSMTSDRWDIQAKMPDGAKEDQVPEMLQGLLAERFKVKIHKENRDQPVYALVVAKGGAKLKESPPEAAPKEDEPKTPQNAVSVRQEGQGMVVKAGKANMRMSMGPNMTMRMESDRVSMEQFADMIGGFVDRPVVDMTELKGNFQIALDLTMDDLRAAAAKAGVAMPAMPGGGGASSATPGGTGASDPTGPGIFSSIQQLGLKLETRKAPVESVVVDSAEKTPTEN